MSFKEWSFSRNIQNENITTQILYGVLLFCMVGALVSNGVIGFTHFLPQLWVAGFVSALTLLSIFRLGMLIIKDYEKTSRFNLFNITLGLIGCTLCIVSAPFGGGTPKLISYIGIGVACLSILFVLIGSGCKSNKITRSDKYASLFSIYGIIIFFVA